MKKNLNFKYHILLFFGYVWYLMLEGPINLQLEYFSLSLLYKGFLSNLILLLPLLIFLTFQLLKLNLEKYLTARNKKIFLIPVTYLLFIIAMNFSAFKTAISLDFIFFVFGLCLVGFTEEFLFRGILFPNLSNGFSSIYLGAITSSFLFGITHFINLINNFEYINEITFQVISSFCFGILMCGVLYKTKNLIIPALIHSIYNLQAMIRTFNGIRKNQIPLSENKEIFHPSIWELLNQELMFNLLCLITGIVLIYIENKKEMREITTGNNA